MARLKFTRPPPATTPLTSNGKISFVTKTKEQTEMVSQSTVAANLVSKQQQSLEMVQIMLHVSFGTLFYLREFLPLQCFDDRDMKQALREQTYSYQEFINGKLPTMRASGSPERAFGQGKKGQPLKILVRNSDPKVDVILDLLEHGIFDALKKKYLEAIQLTVVADKEAPSDVLETYTFSFKYTDDSAGVDSCLESLSLDPVGCVADMQSIHTARIGLEMIVRRLITLSAFLPTLPNRRNLGIHLLYTKDCPSEYEPSGFTVATDETIRYPLNEDWKKESQSCGTMDSGAYSVGLKVTSLKWTGPDPEGSEIMPAVPRQIEYNDEVSRTADVGFSEETSILDETILGKTGTGEPTQQLEPESTGDDMTNEMNSYQESTQTRQDVIEKQRLQEMIPPTSPSVDSDLVPTQPFNPGSTLNLDNRPPQRVVQRRRLVFSKFYEINEHLRLNPPEHLENPQKEHGSPVTCQCGWKGEEPEMIECAFCHSRQHLLCYGYRNTSDPRIPDVHACYACLLQPNEVHLLQGMGSLILMRRALMIILAEGYPTSYAQFAEKLRCSSSTASRATEFLREQKIVQPTPGYKRPGFLHRGQPRFSIRNSEATRQKIETEFLDPMVRIRHHYTLEDEQGAVEGAHQEAEYTSTMNVRDKDHTIDIVDEDDQETQGSEAEFMASFDTNGSLKRKQLESSILHEDDEEPADMPAKQESHAPPLESPKHRMSLRSAEQKKVSTPLHEESPSVRRSTRKRRKISNYKQLIDVGQVTSDEDYRWSNLP